MHEFHLFAKFDPRNPVPQGWPRSRGGRGEVKQPPEPFPPLPLSDGCPRPAAATPTAGGWDFPSFFTPTQPVQRSLLSPFFAEEVF